jgi:hypothetical protein
MRVRGQTSALLRLAAEVLELLHRQPALQKRARVDARRGMPLEEDHVAVVTLALAFEEVVEADLIERRRRRKRRDMSPDAVAHLVGADHHRQGIPPYKALDPPLERLVAGKRGLLRRRDRIDVGRIR